MSSERIVRSATLAACLSALAAAPAWAQEAPRARNVILFVGDGMGVSTVTATRLLGRRLRRAGRRPVPVHGTFAHLLGRHGHPRQRADHERHVSGVNTNNGVIGFDATTEFDDFHGDGDGAKSLSVFEQA